MKTKILSVILTVMCICIIIGFTLQTGEKSASSSNFMAIILSRLFHIDDIQALEHYIRKLAHFSEYAVLGILLTWTFRVWGMNRRLLVVIFVCLAGCDELIQRFIPDRGPSFIDVLIDYGGALFGMCLTNMFSSK